MEVVITRRFFSFILAGVIAASTIFPSSAWNSDSFISGGSEYEPPADVVLSDDFPLADVYAAPRRARMVKVSAADQAAAEANTTGKLVVPATLPTSVDAPTQIMSKAYYKSSAGGVKVESDYWRDIVATIPLQPVFPSGYPFLYYIFGTFIQYTADVSDPNDMIRGLALFCDKSSGIFPPGYTIANSSGGNLGVDSWVLTSNYDVSAYGSSAFSLDGVDSVKLGVEGPYWGGWHSVYPLSVDILVDGQQVLTLSRGTANYIDFGGYVFSGSADISTISFRWHMPFNYFISDSPSFDGTYSFDLRSFVSVDDPTALTISFLDGQDVINAQNNKTKGDINKHEEYESQWTGSMTENFNALGFSDFSWSDSLVSGFSLFSGIFMDIWRALGGATILFTFPLLLGIALLLVGRISRSGGRSGSGKGGGDGG